MNSRIIKQATIAIIFLFIVVSVGYLSYQKLSSIENLCLNNQRDKDEEGIDCGAVCGKNCLVIKDLEISNNQLISIGVNSAQSEFWDYDVLIEVKNPNFSHGAAGSYKLDFFNDEGEPILSKNGSFYILPGQEKILIESPIKTNDEITSFDVVFEPEWKEMKNYRGEVLFSSKRREYEILQRPNEFGRLQGIISNESNFNFDKVDVIAVLYGVAEGEEIGGGEPILAVGKTNLETFNSKTERFFEIKWPNRFEGTVERIDIRAYSNILDDSNLLKGEESQQQF